MLLAVAVGSLGAYFAFGSEQTDSASPPQGDKTLVVAAGCFWCVEAIFEELRGVSKVESGYTGGKLPNPTYEQVCAGITGHAEAVRVYYNSAEISADDLLRIFFTTHDPTTLNRQGPDSGTQYRSAIFYSNDEEKLRGEKIIKEIDEAKIWSGPIVTTLEPLKEFYLAEEYHQNYYDAYENGGELQRARMNGGYCRAVIEPKVAKFRKMYRDKLKKK
ncbi:MAG: peptide-methionine (S)-S-oxide reductase MsrA [Armatimonadota bacterium]|nr:peptide-methionine (S)-S-oxide reductase MsrA [Armatimonadota bacterium]